MRMVRWRCSGTPQCAAIWIRSRLRKRFDEISHTINLAALTRRYNPLFRRIAFNKSCPEQRV
jgi:hypothetical protein